MGLVRRTLDGFRDGGEGFLRIYRPRPTAAFSPRDTVSEQFSAAGEALTGLGFTPVERRAGGLLAVYDENALVIDLAVPHDEPHPHVIERFRLFSGAIAATLRKLPVDARVGALDGEYCPGDYSINAQGRIKLVGVAQRVNRRGYHMGAVISVLPSNKARAAVAKAYAIMGIAFDPATFGAIADLAPAATFTGLRQELAGAMRPLFQALPDGG